MISVGGLTVRVPVRRAGQSERRAKRPRRPHVRLAIAVSMLVAAMPLLGPPAARADAASVINALREAGCSDRTAAGTPVERDDRLDRVARDLSRAYALEQAIERAAYPTRTASSLHLRGPRDDDAIHAAIAERFCRSVNNPLYNEIGIFESGDEMWIVLAQRRRARPMLEPGAVERVLELVNAARAEARRCGTNRFGATEPLRLSEILNAAAEGHAWDMAARGYAGHDGSDGSTSGDRITRAGYAWRAAGENIAAGQPDAESVVEDWLQSPPHCATLMAPHFAETGIAFAEVPSKNPSIYWTQVFAAPR